MNRVINTTKVSRVPQDPDNVYLDLNITNLKSANTNPVPINFNENRNSPVVSNSGMYNLSIVRFSLETQTLPIFIPIIASTDPTTGLPNTDPNLTIYSVTMSYLKQSTGVTYTQQTYIEWSPQNTLTPTPPPPSSNPSGLQAESVYYYCFSFTWWVNLIQNAMFNCWIDLVSQVTAGDLDDIPPPIIQFNPDNQTCSVSCPSPSFDTYIPNTTFPFTPPAPNPYAVKLFFNAPLFNLFSSFPATLSNYSSTQGETFQLLVSNFGGSNQIYYPTSGDPNADPPTSYLYTQIFQEYSTIENWTPVSAIVFTTSTIPVIPNQVSAPLIYVEGAVLSNNTGNNSNFQLVLTDLESGDLCYKPQLQYSPTAEYRRISLTGTSPLSNIQVSVYWKTKMGVLIPFLLGSGSSATIKMLFTKVSSIYNEEN